MRLESGQYQLRVNFTDFLGASVGLVRSKPTVCPGNDAKNAVGAHARRTYVTEALVRVAFLNYCNESVFVLMIQASHVLRPGRTLAADVAQVLPDVDVQQRVVFAIRG